MSRHLIVVGRSQPLTKTSWWIDRSPMRFTAFAYGELERMNRSKFAHIVILARGPDVPSAWEAARTRKAEAGRSSSSVTAVAS